MKTKANAKRTTAGTGTRVNYTFDRNGAFVVDPYSLLTNQTVRAQISTAAKMGRMLGTGQFKNKKR